MYVSQRISVRLGIVTLACVLSTGCVSSFGSTSSTSRKSDLKGRVVEDEDHDDLDPEEEDFKKQTRELRGEPKTREASDSWLDKYIWSSESRDIFSSLNVNP